MLNQQRILLSLLPWSLAILSVASAAAQAPPAVNFAAPQVLGSSGNITNSSPVAADLNGDGRMDFVTGQRGLWALINNGDGTFTTKSITTDNVLGFAVADINRDGIPDLVYLEWDGSSSRLFIARGVGDGTFVLLNSFLVAAGNVVVSGIAIGDFSGNGWPDIAVSLGGAENVVTIYLNQQNGFFSPGNSYNAGGVFLAADLNGDTIPDLVVGGLNGDAVTILWGKGLGTFAPGGTYSTGPGPSSIAVGDVNSDGFVDLAVTDSGGVTLLLGSADGTFKAGTPVHEPGAGSVVLADLNGDGKLDLAIAAAVDNNSGTVSGDLSHVSVYPGNGTGAFPTHKVYGIGETPLHLVAADMNDDGHLDLAVGTNALIVLYGEGSGEFQAAPVTLNNFATGMVSGDFNRDGTPDIAVVNTPVCTAPCNGTVSVMLGTGKNYLGATVKYPIGMHGAAVATGDVNGDGLTDLVVTNNTAGDTYDLAVLLGNGNGTFKPAQNEHLGFLSADAVLADVNGDHKLDLVTDAGVALGNGNGTFGAVIPYPALTNAVPTHVAVADFNKDGFPDIAVSTTNAPGVIGGGDAVSILKGNGTGNFTLLSTANPEFGQSVAVLAIAAGDLNGDGAPDIAVSGSSPLGGGSAYGYISVMFNHGDGTFPLAAEDTTNFYQISTYPGGAPPSAIAIADLNGDGLPDVAAAATKAPFGFNPAPDSITALINNGKGGPAYVSGFNSPVSFLATAGPTGSIAIADFNKDGLPDIATTSQLGVSLLFNTGVAALSPTGLSWAKVTIGNTSAPKTVTVTNATHQPRLLHAAVGGAEASEFRIYANTCNATIAANATCAVTIAFRPTAAGKQEATLSISENGAIVGTAPLAGIGALP